jgi:hypothetical protein
VRRRRQRGAKIGRRSMRIPVRLFPATVIARTKHIYIAEILLTIQVQFPDGDSEPVDAQVPEAQNARAVGHDDSVHL